MKATRLRDWIWRSIHGSPVRGDCQVTPRTINRHRIHRLSFDDLLCRAPIGLDGRPLTRLLHGHRVMVTGAGGSIGSELCLQIARVKPVSLVMFDRYENSLRALQLELEDAGLVDGLVPVIGDVTDQVLIDEVLSRYRPEIVFHAAAHKHVALMEENPCEAIKNNVRGTRLLVSAAERWGVDRFIYISTDKAVNPMSVMGASKRVAELVVQNQAIGSGTSLSIVRFGNVLGSNGSVVPRFEAQIRRGGPVTITHPDVRRFFMLASEAVQLVLHAASRAESGATYVLDMGEQVHVADMARHMIRLLGLVPDEDIKIEYIGLGRGEKLTEELIGPDETATSGDVEQILRVHSVRPPAKDLMRRVEALEHAAATGDAGEVLRSLKDLIGFDPARPQHRPEPATLTQPGARSERAERFRSECPTCHARSIRRSRARSTSERVWKYFTTDRPFRCRSCGWRGWLTPADAGDAPALQRRPLPDLAALDYSAQLMKSPPAAFRPRELA